MRGLLAIGFVCVISACGGSAEEAPKPLTHHFDDMYIAAIPVDDQKAAFDAQHAWTVSLAEDAKAQSDLNESTNQLGYARNDLKAAHLAVENAVNAKKQADASADTNRINQSTKDLHNAEDAEKATQLRVNYLETFVRYMRGYQVYTAANMYWHEAQFEAQKAKIAQSHKIAPKNVSFDSFPSQQNDRQSRWQREKNKVESSKGKVLTARDAWMKMQKQADSETGHATTAWDPLVNHAAQTGAGAPQQQVEPTSGPTNNAAPQ